MVSDPERDRTAVDRLSLQNRRKLPYEKSSFADAFCLISKPGEILKSTANKVYSVNQENVFKQTDYGKSDAQP